MEIIQSIQNRIYTIRGSRVMLDRDLAELYGTETKVLNQAVKRNPLRFPPDFMFQLTTIEWEELEVQRKATDTYHSRSQFVTLNISRGQNIKYLPYVFTEQGVAMLSSVLHSGRAIQMNIAIMRAFVEVRRLLLDTSEVFHQLQHLRERIGEHDTQLRAIYDALENLLDDKVAQTKWENRQRIGFKTVHKS